MPGKNGTACVDRIHKILNALTMSSVVPWNDNAMTCVVCARPSSPDQITKHKKVTITLINKNNIGSF
jgi:hypothetical protein